MSTDQRKRKRRWGDAATPAPAPAPASAPSIRGAAIAIDSKSKALALQESIRARLAALKAKTGGAKAVIATTTTKAAVPTTTSSLKKRPAPSEPNNNNNSNNHSSSSAPSLKRAKHFELDMTVTGPTYNQKPEPAKPKVNPYLAHKQQPVAEGGKEEEQGEEGGTKVGIVEEQDANVDDRVQVAKIRKRHKALTFVEPGTFVEIGERKRLKAANAEQSGFASGRKAGMYFASQNMANIYGSTEVNLEDDDHMVAPRPEANDKTTFPFVLEWWDVELLPSKLKKQVGAYEGKALSKETQSQLQQLDSKKSGSATASQLVNDEVQELQTRCFEQAALSYSKTAALIQHIVPIKPPNAKEGPSVEPTLYLTKRELKRQRKLRRTEKLRDLQDLQAAGLAEAPEPRLTLKNFIRVLGDQAFVDPSQMENKVKEQVQARQRAHLDRNEQNKLTTDQRKAKLAKKIHEDTSEVGVHVALFYVKDMSHPYHRTKVDLNAQQYNITGGVLECENPKLSCVICEGGPKSIKRYTRLMCVRMKWKGPDNFEEESDEEDEPEGEDEDGVVRHKFNSENKCGLVWTGMATKRFFKGFVFQACETSSEATKILRAKGVGHFWDQILTHASGRGDTFQLKLAESEDEEDEVKNNERTKVEEDVEMEDS